MNFLSALEQCRQRARHYLAGRVVEVDDAYYWRHSTTHDPNTHPGHLLYGTWAGALASILIGEGTEFDAATRSRIGRALNRYQQTDGTYTMRGLPGKAGSVPSDEYHVFHCTNYAWGALRALGGCPRFGPSFMARFDSAALERWLAERDWRYAWREGNNVVNLASSFAILSEDGLQWAAERLEQMIGWLDHHQDRNTGFWHLGNGDRRDSLLDAMAGAAHNLHLYYHVDRPVPYGKQVIDSCLRLGYMGIRNACIDLDVIDILSNLRGFGHRHREIDSVLKRYLIELLQIQNDDGGFGDNSVTPHTMYGHTTPARASVTWTTWFRLVAIGMLACTFIPAERTRWAFRKTLGSGYCNLAYSLRSSAGDDRLMTGWQGSSLRGWGLATVRNVRFARERVTWRARELLSQGQR